MPRSTRPARPSCSASRPSSRRSSSRRCGPVPRSSRASRPRSRARSRSLAARSPRRQCPPRRPPDILAVSHTRGGRTPTRGCHFEETGVSAHAKKKPGTRPQPRTPGARNPGSAQRARKARAAATSTEAASKSEIARQLRAQLAALTGGLAPDDYLKAWWEWYLKLATQPPRQAQLAHSAYEKTLDSLQFMTRAAGGAPLAPGHEELGFTDAAWNVWPFNAYARAYGNWASWWKQPLTPAAAAADPDLSRELRLPR